MTEQGGRPQIEPGLSAPESERRQFLQYLAGYFDASGSVTLEKSKKGIVLRLDLQRTSPVVVDLMRKTFPVYEGERIIPSKKVAHRWYAKGPRAMHVLDELFPFFRIKAGHYRLAQEFTATKGLRNKEEAFDFKERMRSLNKNPELKTDAKLEAPYLAGIFDAHGSIIFWGEDRQDLMIGINIKNEKFLEFIKRETGLGHIVPLLTEGIIRGRRLGATANKARDFLLIVSPFLRVKRELAELAIEFQNTRTPLLRRETNQERRAKESGILARIQQLSEPK